jgi:cytochrome c oxidase subunit II
MDLNPSVCHEQNWRGRFALVDNGKRNCGLRISDCGFGGRRKPTTASCSDDPQSAIRNPQFLLIPFAPDQASTVSGTVDDLYLFLVGLTVFFSVLITALIIYFALKYRRRSDDEYPRPIEGSMKLESVWIVIPFIIVMVIFVWGASVYFAVFRPPEEALDVYVVGKQWMWKFEHPDGQREINELHVPIGRRVKLVMATEDVIHAVFVPAFRVKADVVPGKYTSIWFEPTKPGRYHLYCAEYCGTGHSRMIGWVEVMTPADYQAWLSGGVREEPLAVRGQKVFASLACNNCHRSDGTGRGPALDGLFGKQVELETGQTIVADENYIRESILNPKAKILAGYQPVMPTFQGLLSEEQLLQLVSYIKSLSPQSGGPGGSRGATEGNSAPGGQQQETKKP